MSAEGSGLVPGDHPDRIRWNAKWAAGPALVLGIGFWDAAVFAAAAAAVADGGLLAWEALTADARRRRSDLPPEFCVGPGEPASLLPGDFILIDQTDDPHRARRRLLGRRLRW